MFDKKTLLNIAVLTLTFYLFKRFDGSWCYYTFQLPGDYLWVFNKIRYWDVLTISLILPAIINVFSTENPLSDFSDNPNGFVQDNPVFELVDDTFTRNHMACQIKEMITFTNNRRSFAIGILGEYGSGKTSFLNLINAALPKDGYAKLQFNPWDSDNALSIQKDFFDQLVSVIATIDPKISSLVHSYSRKISRLDDTSRSWINRIRLFGSAGSASSGYEKLKINKALQRSNKKIIITIDDLDRLHSDEVIEVLKIIRNTGDFSKVFYIVAYEKAYVQNAIKTLNEEGNHNYLEKIFQVEVPLPKRDENALIEFLKGKIKPTLTARHFSLLEDKIIPNDFNSQYGESCKSIFRHSRDVIKFVNGFKMTYILIGEEVDFEDLFVLELLKFRFQLLYDMIYEHRGDFIHLNPSVANHQEYYVATGNTLEKDSVSNFRKFTLTTPLVKQNEIELINTLFAKLFKGGSWYRPESKNGISYPMYFEIFFKQRLSNYDLSDKDFKVALYSPNLHHYIDDCVSKNLHNAILARLFQEEPNGTNLVHYEKIINALFYLGPQYVLKTSPTSFPYHQLIELFTNNLDRTVKNLYNNNAGAFQDFVKSLFNSARPPYLFENELIYHIRESRRIFVIPDEELIDHQITYFNRYVESSHGLSENAVWLFWGIREYYLPENVEGQVLELTWRFVPKSLPRLVRALKETNPAYFLKKTIKLNLGEENLAGISQQIIDIFDTPGELRNIIFANEYLNDDVKMEYLNLFDRLAASSFSHMVPMTFKTMLRKEG
jgi:GTPase SAR1 family protein